MKKRGSRLRRRVATSVPTTAPATETPTFDRAVAQFQAGEWTAASRTAEALLAAAPNDPRLLHLRGAALLREEGPEAAEAPLERAVALAPEEAVFHNTLGEALRLMKRLPEAEERLNKALALDPDFPEALNNLGATLLDQGEAEEAVRSYRRAIKVKPEFPLAWSNLSSALRALGKLRQAAEAAGHALTIAPDLAIAWSNLGAALTALDRGSDAVNAAVKAVELEPDNAEFLNNLGLAHKAAGQPDEAARSLTRAVEISPEDAIAWNNLGHVHTDLGQAGEAIAAYRRAVALDPQYREAHANLIMAMNYDPEVSQEEILKESQTWCGNFAPPGRSLPASKGTLRTPDKRLKVGFVSPDFRTHPVSRFLLPLLEGFDPAGVETFLYAQIITMDGETNRLQGQADHWRNITRLSDREAGEMIRADGIDVLVELAGFTAKSRLALFAHRPAPIQAAWLGYPNTTGMTAMDVRLVDDLTDPEGEADRFSSETLVRLENGFLCFGAPEGAPEPPPSPFLKNGFVTFGSFNNLAKVNDPLLGIWGKLLDRLPGARLLMKDKSLDQEETRETFRRRFQQAGGDPARLDFLGRLPTRTAALESFARADIALDPFPYNGTTTTCESLWMGVPVLTLRGDRHVSRVSAALLHRIGLSELATDTSEALLDTGVELAGDGKRLTQLRGGLRERMRASPLMDKEGFARTMERTFRDLWTEWLKNNR